MANCKSGKLNLHMNKFLYGFFLSKAAPTKAKANKDKRLIISLSSFCQDKSAEKIKFLTNDFSLQTRRTTSFETLRMLLRTCFHISYSYSYCMCSTSICALLSSYNLLFYGVFFTASVAGRLCFLQRYP